MNTTRAFSPGICLGLLWAVCGMPFAVATDASGAKTTPWSVRLGGVSVEPSSSSRVNRGTPAEGTVEFQKVHTLAAGATYRLAYRLAFDL
jgi:hypothetical protein